MCHVHRVQCVSTEFSLPPFVPENRAYMSLGTETRTYMSPYTEVEPPCYSARNYLYVELELEVPVGGLKPGIRKAHLCTARALTPL